LAPPNTKNPAASAMSAIKTMMMTERGTGAALFDVAVFREPV